MSFPTIPDLPSASAPADTDQMLIRQPAGALGTDKKVTMAQIRNLNLAGLSSITLPLIDSDLLLVARGGTNYSATMAQISFKSGTRMWFYQDSAPTGWAIDAPSDTLLACKGGSTYLIGGTINGTWKQPDHALKVNEIPSHSHVIGQRGASSGSGNIVRGSPNPDKSATDTFTSNPTGGGKAHNHGDTYRPKAAIGIIAVKD